MTNEIIKRMLIGVIGTVIFSLSLAIFAYEPISNRQPNSTYMSLLGLFIIYAIYSLPIYIFAGVLWSFIIDKIYSEKQSNFKYYFKKLVAYTLAGALSSVVFIFIYAMSHEITNYTYLYIGIIASLIYYHIFIIWEHF